MLQYKVLYELEKEYLTWLKQEYNKLKIFVFVIDSDNKEELVKFQKDKIEEILKTIEFKLLPIMGIT